MKTIFKIARTELSLLFYSPIAWFLLVAFLFQCGLAYTSSLEEILTTQEIGGYGLRFLTFLTSKIYEPPFGILVGLVGKLYLYLPLLTMGLMSREINGGTIRLLYSSPLDVREIILGKYLAMLVYNLALVAIVGLIFLCGVFNIVAVDGGTLLSALVGIYLLLAAYAAIGLFMSCLTSYQVVAALSTLVIFAVLNYVGTLWQGVDFVRDLSWFLSISGRTDHMLMGLITTKDVLYFVVIIVIFLGFGIYKLHSDMESRPFWVKASRYVLIFVFALGIGYVGSRPGLIGYADLTATKSMTLTPVSQQVVKELGDTTLEVTSYINLLDTRYYYGAPEKRNEDMARWEPYLRFKPSIKFKYVYYYGASDMRDIAKYNPGKSVREVAEKYAKSYHVDLAGFKTQEEIRKIIDLRGEEDRYVMQLSYKGKTTFLRLFNDQLVFPTEAETDAAIKRLLLPSMPKIAFVQGDHERSIDKLGDRQYKMISSQITFRYALVNQGFDVEGLSLSTQDIPKDISALVIADPRSDFDSVTLAKLRDYIAAGGNLLIAGEPGKQSVLNPLLQPLGVQMMDGMVVQKTRNFAPDLLQSQLCPKTAILTKALQNDAGDSLPLTTPGAAALSYTNGGAFAITPFVLSNGLASWNKKIPPTEDMLLSGDEQASQQLQRSRGGVSDGSGDGESKAEPVKGVRAKGETSKNAAVNAGKTQAKGAAWQGLSFSPEEGDQKGPLPIVLGLTRLVKGKEQRILVSGDADFLSNSELSRFNIRSCNFNFSSAIFNWFSHGQFPIDASRVKGKDNRLSLTSRGLTGLKVFLLGILPGILLLSGAILLIRRKRK